MAVSLEQFVEQLSQTGLVSADEVSTLCTSLPEDQRPADVQALAKLLIRQGKLTKYQAQAIYNGEHRALVFHEYVVLDRIGAGGMGVVLKAKHRRMDRVVAIKVLPAEALKSPDAVERFYREVKAAARLHHPNIVTAYDASEHEGMHYLVMEFVDGQDLAAILGQHGPLGVPQAVECVIQAARGLEYAHGMGIIHRDIKPGNLLLHRNGTVKILDMGLALLGEAVVGDVTTAAQLTQSGQIMGTIDYMSPEQAQDTHRADERSDIYSLGCTLYRLLTGEPPYLGDSLTNRIVAHLQQPVPSLAERRADVPAALDAVFAKMLAKDPATRQQSMGQVIVELEAALSPEAAGRQLLVEPSSNSALSEFVQQLGSDQATAAAPPTTAGDAQTISRTSREEQTGDQVGRPSRPTGSGETPDLQAKPSTAQPKRKRTRLILWLTTAGALCLAAALGLPYLLVPPADNGDREGPPNTSGPLAVGKKAGQEWDGNSIKMKFCWCPDGTFKMGETGAKVDVTLTRGFWMGKTEVTQAQWTKVMRTRKKEWGTQPDTKAGDDYPATWVSWNNATMFCEELTRQERAAGRLPPGWEYRLPTEAQWEYACRAGTQTVYSFGDDMSRLDDYAWFDANSRHVGQAFAHRVATKLPNPWGLHDMHGNVWKWCRDGYQDNPPGGTDPEVTKLDSRRVVRGGSWSFDAAGCRTVSRAAFIPGNCIDCCGFRVAAVQVAPVSVGTKAGQEWDDNGLKMKFCWCPDGKFKMGDGAGAPDVTLTRGFWLGKTEVTQAQWTAVMNTRPKEWGAQADTKAGDDFPATWVSWDEATKFCEALTQQEREADRLPIGWEYRLPTEAQWEYACRAGTQAAYSFGDDVQRLGDYAWFATNTRGADQAYAHEVAKKAANPWGLLDIHGNVHEWCRDWFQVVLPAGSNPEVTKPGMYRVVRGGGWTSDAGSCTAFIRGWNTPELRNRDFGFRVALTSAAAARGYALKFDDRDESVTCRLKTPLTGPFTVEFWAKPKDVPVGQGGQLLTFGEMALWRTPPTGMPRISRWAFGGGDQKIIYSNVPSTAGTWLHFAIVSDGGRCRLYVDGKRQQQTIPLQGFRVEDFALGKDPMKSQFKSRPGLFDEFRVSKTIRYKTESFDPPGRHERFEPDTDTLALYHFDDGPGSGRVVDASGQNNHGKIVGEVQWVPSEGLPALPHADHALKFDGKTSYVEIASLAPDKYAWKLPITLEARVRMRRSVRRATVVAMHGPFRLQLVVEDQPRWEAARISGGQVGHRRSERWNDEGKETWIEAHLAAVMDQEGAHLFVDGAKVKDVEHVGGFPANWPGSPVLIGAHRTFGKEPIYFFDGTIDEVRISTSARYQQDFKPRPRLSADKDTLALYHFDEGRGETLNDASGNGHDGTIVRATWVGADGQPAR